MNERLGILLIPKDKRREPFELALSAENVHWTLLAVVKPQRETVCETLQQMYRQRHDRCVVVIDHVKGVNAEGIVRTILAVVPRQEIIVIADKPLDDQTLQVTHVTDVRAAVRAIKKVKLSSAS